MTKLTEKQVFWLTEMRDHFMQTISVYHHKPRPPAVLMHKLEDAGYCTNIMDTFWKLTPEGLEKINQLSPK
ncbi:hypothetical protein CHUUTOTORO_02850 [Serratia phage vB_SmaM-ChuuTotoro]|nr:hypothetical protein CHUUTOTORO_02850 [Serratia phage vB_SmaM-ChuuTotoro]